MVSTSLVCDSSVRCGKVGKDGAARLRPENPQPESPIGLSMLGASLLARLPLELLLIVQRTLISINISNSTNQDR